MLTYSTRQCNCGRGLIPKHDRICRECWKERNGERHATNAAKAAAYQATYRRVRDCRVCGSQMVLNYADRLFKTCAACLAEKNKPTIGQCVYCNTPMPERPYNAKFCAPCEIARYPWKANAASAVARALRMGELSPASQHSCEDCGAPAKHWDHRDYSKPLEVAPVCRRCNILRGPAAFPNRPQESQA